jgi:hypothetical protein
MSAESSYWPLAISAGVSCLTLLLMVSGTIGPPSAAAVVAFPLTAGTIAGLFSLFAEASTSGVLVGRSIVSIIYNAGFYLPGFRFYRNVPRLASY